MMNKVSVVIVLLALLSFKVHAQFIEGEVIYKQTICFLWDKMEKENPGIGSIKGMLPDKIELLHSLYINANESLFKEKDSLITNSLENSELVDEIAKGAFPSDIYMNRAENTFMEVLESEEIIIVDSLSNINVGWEIVSEKKEVLNYSCIKARHRGSGMTVWFTPQIPNASGPSFFVNLPGLVLQTEYVEDGVKYTFTAIEIVKKDISGRRLKPSKYKLMSREKYKEIYSY